VTRCAVTLLLAFVAVPRDGDAADGPTSPLRVLYVGNAREARARHFATFLAKHFAHVAVADRAAFDPAAARDADVVLLDWSQRDGPLEKTAVPLGRLEDWQKPTVLLNSAGLLVAARWGLIGGAG
jgi:hypothetical protein